MNGCSAWIEHIRLMRLRGRGRQRIVCWLGQLDRDQSTIEGLLVNSWVDFSSRWRSRDFIIDLDMGFARFRAVRGKAARFGNRLLSTRRTLPKIDMAVNQQRLVNNRPVDDDASNIDFSCKQATLPAGTVLALRHFPSCRGAFKASRRRAAGEIAFRRHLTRCRFGAVDALCSELTSPMYQVKNLVIKLSRVCGSGSKRSQRKQSFDE